MGRFVFTQGDRDKKTDRKNYNCKLYLFMFQCFRTRIKPKKKSKGKIFE